MFREDSRDVCTVHSFGVAVRAHVKVIGRVCTRVPSTPEHSMRGVLIVSDPVSLPM